jgi:hypothetical protein
MINTPENGSVDMSPLSRIVENNDGDAFYTNFSNTLNNRTGTQSSDKIQFMANVSYVQQFDKSINSTPLNSSRPLYGNEHAVHISQWIIVENRQFPGWGSTYSEGKHAALVEVLLWRD